MLEDELFLHMSWFRFSGEVMLVFYSKCVQKLYKREPILLECVKQVVEEV